MTHDGWFFWFIYIYIYIYGFHVGKYTIVSVDFKKGPRILCAIKLKQKKTEKGTPRDDAEQESYRNPCRFLSGKLMKDLHERLLVQHNFPKKQRLEKTLDNSEKHFGGYSKMWPKRSGSNMVMNGDLANSTIRESLINVISFWLFDFGDHSFQKWGPKFSLRSVKICQANTATLKFTMFNSIQ